MKKSTLGIAFALVSFFCSPAFAANAFTGYLEIVQIRQKFDQNSMIVVLDGITTVPSNLNPASCSVTSGFLTDPINDDAILQLQHSMLLSAMMAGRNVELVIDDSGCASNYPRILGVRLE